MARLLSILLIAFAIFCTPMVMHMGDSTIARFVPAEGSHGCKGMVHHAPDQQMPDLNASCPVACAAIPVLPITVPGEAMLIKAELFIGPTPRLTGMGPKAEIPPPRCAPAI